MIAWLRSWWAWRRVPEACKQWRCEGMERARDNGAIGYVCPQCRITVMFLSGSDPQAALLMSAADGDYIVLANYTDPDGGIYTLDP